MFVPYFLSRFVSKPDADRPPRRSSLPAVLLASVALVDLVATLATLFAAD